MAKIYRNEFGVMSINNDVLADLILKIMLEMDEDLIPCNKKGKLVKKSFFRIIEDAENVVEIKEINRSDISICVYFVARFGRSINRMTENLFDRIEEELGLMCVDKPKILTAKVKGILAKNLAERNLELTRNNE